MDRKTDYTYEQIQALSTMQLEETARMYKIDTGDKTFNETAAAIFDAQLEQEINTTQQ